ncbi:MAG: hypothetical protein ACREIF_03375 [Chthoniobacterales bacterium]
MASIDSNLPIFSGYAQRIRVVYVALFPQAPFIMKFAVIIGKPPDDDEFGAPGQLESHQRSRKSRGTHRLEFVSRSRFRSISGSPAVVDSS